MRSEKRASSYLINERVKIHFFEGVQHLLIGNISLRKTFKIFNSLILIKIMLKGSEKFTDFTQSKETCSNKR